MDLPKILKTKINRENLSLVGVLIILTAIPLTVILLGIRQELRKGATGVDGTILINNGAETTNSREVTLTLIAPTQQSFLQIPQTQAATTYNQEKCNSTCQGKGYDEGVCESRVSTCTEWMLGPCEVIAGGVTGPCEQSLYLCTCRSRDPTERDLLNVDCNSACQDAGYEGGWCKRGTCRASAMNPGVTYEWLEGGVPGSAAYTTCAAVGGIERDLGFYHRCCCYGEGSSAPTPTPTRPPSQPTPTPTTPPLDPTPTPTSATVVGMIISNYSDFGERMEEPFATTKSWILTPEDGLKTVWAKFRMSDGTWTTPVSDSITLNTGAGPTPTPTTPAGTPTPTPTTPPGTPTPTPDLDEFCDFNEDGQVTLDDLELAESCWHQPLSCCPKCDMDNDGDIDVVDLEKFSYLCYDLIPTPTPPPNGYLKLDLLKVWFQEQKDLLGRGHEGAVILALKQGDGVVFEEAVQLDENGEARDVELPGVEAGTYNAFIYEAGYLTKKLANVTIDETSNELDFTKGETEYFLVGDFNGDQEVNVLDFSIFVESYGKTGTSE